MAEIRYRYKSGYKMCVNENSVYMIRKSIINIVERVLKDIDPKREFLMYQISEPDPGSLIPSESFEIHINFLTKHLLRQQTNIVVCRPFVESNLEKIILNNLLRWIVTLDGKPIDWVDAGEIKYVKYL